MQHTRIITGLLVVIVLARVVESSSGSTPPSQAQSDQRHSREIEVELAQCLAQLKASDQEERREAALRLSHIESNAATSALISALADPSPRVRAVVVAGLGGRKDPAVITLVAARLSSDKDAFVRKTAAYALGIASGTERTSALIAALTDKEAEVRGAAAVSLGDHADAVAVAALANVLDDDSAFVRARAAHALGVNGSAAMQAVPALIRLLASDPDGEVKRKSATALGSIGDRSALPALHQAARNSDSYLAEAARDSIRMIEGTR